jgi:hypothetical protein
VAWRYIAQRLDGLGGGEFLDYDVPLSSPSITTVLSGPNALSGTITPEVARLQDSKGHLVFEEWSTALYAEEDGNIRGAGILANIGTSGPTVSLDCVGWTGYAAGMPYTDSWFGVEVDPLGVVRQAWAHLQSKVRGNIGLQVSDMTTGLKIGQELEQVEFDTQAGPVSFEAGPIKLAWYLTDDIGQFIDSLAKETPFDYQERHAWVGDQIEHYLDFGYPSLGRRRPDLRFQLGENVSVVPSIVSNSDSFANEVLALGAGEGRDMIRGGAIRSADTRLRRVAVVTDKQRRSKAKANAYASEQLALRLGLGSIEEIVVREHPHAAIGSWRDGDEILIAGNEGWGGYEMWVRVLSTTINPLIGDVATISVARTGMVTK